MSHETSKNRGGIISQPFKPRVTVLKGYLSARKTTEDSSRRGILKVTHVDFCFSIVALSHLFSLNYGLSSAIKGLKKERNYLAPLIINRGGYFRGSSTSSK